MDKSDFVMEFISLSKALFLAIGIDKETFNNIKITIKANKERITFLEKEY